MNRQGMHTAGKLTVQQSVNHTMPLQRSLTREGLAHRNHLEMTLCTLRDIVPMAFIQNLKVLEH
jgi:hypothetical protein